MRLSTLACRLIALRDIVAIVEPDQFGAGLDHLVVGHRHVDDGGGDLRADLHRAGIDKGVVGRFVVPGMQPPEDDREDGEDGAANDNGDQPSPGACAMCSSSERFFVSRAGSGLRLLGGNPDQLGIGAALVIDALIHDRRLNV